MDMAMRSTPGLTWYQSRVIANLENLEEFTLLVGVVKHCLRISVSVMDAEAQHKLGMWSVHGVRADTVGGQRYGSISDMIEVDEVFAEVFV